MTKNPPISRNRERRPVYGQDLENTVDSGHTKRLTGFRVTRLWLRGPWLRRPWLRVAVATSRVAVLIASLLAFFESYLP